MGFFKKFLNSLYNFKAYNTFLAQTTGKAVLYMLILSALLGIISCVSFASYINSYLPPFKEELEKNIPNFEFNNGKLTFEEDMPIVIKDKETDMIIYIDTENPIDDSVLDEYSTGFLITSDSISTKQGIKTESVNLSSLTGWSIYYFRNSRNYII